MGVTVCSNLADLLNQFESIGGPEEYGPEGVSIVVALWRKSSKLGWKESFQMTNTELMVQTGIATRKTLNVYRSKLVEGNVFGYISPPNGSSRGTYNINFNLLEQKPVTVGNSFRDSDGEPVTKPVTSGNSFEEPVTVGNSFGNTVLKDTTAITTDDEFENILKTFCELHGKLDINVKSTDVMTMQEMIALGVPSSLIIRVMTTIYQERGSRVHSFVYYKHAILDAWETEKAITDPVALGVPSSLTEPVALGTSPSQRGYRSRQQQQIDDLQRIIDEEEQREQVGSGKATG